jgi:dTDP-4-dehydrorhamnose 3,5-epimerase
MRIVPTRLPEVLRIEPVVLGDERGFFMETWRANLFEEAGLPMQFVQGNHSRSRRHTLRGLHWQLTQPQGKLVRVVAGEVFDVAVDVRRSSATFGQWVGMSLSAQNKYQLWIPPGFAHGFLVISEYADFVYQCTDYYHPPSERSVAWNDPQIAIEWPLAGAEPQLSAKDRAAPRLDAAECFP